MDVLINCAYGISESGFENLLLEFVVFFKGNKVVLK
jgi:hypothetical protein